LNLAASYRRTWANSLGAEWRIDAQIGYDSFLGAEFIQPLQIRDGAFFAPYAEVQRKFMQFYQQELRLGQYQINTETVGLDAGLSNGLGELRLGPYVAHVRAKPDFGFITSLAPEEDFSVAGIRLSGVADHLDRPRFARSGWSAAANVRTESQDNGAQSQHTRAVLALRGVTSFDKNTFSTLLEIGETPEGKLAIYDGFKLGGPLRLSGLYLDQLTGTRYNLGTLTYYRKYASLPQQLGRGLYLGMSAEAGRMNDTLMKNPWSWIYSGSVFWAADTILGAVVLSYGYSSLDQSTAYLMIGPRF
jgi:NTE family protein